MGGTDDPSVLARQGQREVSARAYGIEGAVVELALRPGDTHATLVVSIGDDTEPVEVKMNAGHVEQLYHACDRVLSAAGIGWDEETRRA